MAQTYFASIQPGLEDYLLEEIRSLGAKKPRVLPGGVEFQGTRKTLYEAHLSLSTPSRIWLRIDEFRARDAPELYNKTRRIPWERLLYPGAKLLLRSYSAQSSLYHTEKIDAALFDGISDRFAEDLQLRAPHRSDAGLLVMTRISDDRAELSLDASGELLHRRGWRTRVGPAPLRESLAATLLKASPWEFAQGLLDPFCGSGTIPIVAARQRLGLLPGSDRSFAFQKWRNYDESIFTTLKDFVATNAGLPQNAAPIQGADLDGEVLKLARENAKTAAVVDRLTWIESPVAQLSLKLEIPASEVSHVVTNPPYGARLDRGNCLQELFQLYDLPFLQSLTFLWPRDSRDLVTSFEKSAQIAASFKNGGLPVDLWVVTKNREH